MKTVASFLMLVICISFSKNSMAARFWVAATASNWNNTANWSASSGGAGGSSVPVAADDVNFDNNGVGNCTIDATVGVKSFTVAAGYTGTIGQGTNPISISTTATFSGGIFSGGSANMTIIAAFTLSGTNFTSTSAILELRDNAAFSSGTFLHNNGTLRFNCTNNAAQTITGTSPSCYTLEFVGISRSYTINSVGNITVANNLIISGAGFYNLLTGAINVSGDINVTNTATGCGGTATINIIGAGTQNFNGGATAGEGALPQFTINKATGTLNLANFPGVSNNFTYAAGTINPGTSTFCFTHGSVGAYSISGSVSLANIEFTVNTSLLTATIPLTTTLTATGNLTLDGPGNLVINTGNININGNITLTNTGNGGGGSATINIVGAGAETMDGTAIIVNESRLPLININNPGGTLTLAGNISFSANVTYTAGTINPGTSTCYIVNNLTMTGNFSLYNLTVSATANTTLTIALGNTVTATNTLDLENGANIININTGTLAVHGNLINNNTSIAGGGTGTILIDGTGAQNITSTGIIDQGRFPAVTINNTGGTVTFPSLITVLGNWTYTAGTLDVTTNNSTVVFENTLTITGNQTLNNIIIDGTGTFTITIPAANILTCNGNMGIIGVSNIILTGGTIDLLGNLNLSNTALAGGGTTVIDFVGTTNQAITGALSINQSRLPAITINKPSGILTFPALITVRGNWTYTTGSYDVTTNNSDIIFANSLTISGNHTLNNIGFDGSGNYIISVAGTTLTVDGNMSMSGTTAFPNNNLTLNGGTINLLGNLILTNTGTSGGGTTIIAFVGAVNQSISSSLAVNQCNLPAVTINKPAGTLSFPALISVRGNWTYTSGTLDVTTNNSTVVFNNNLTITGSHTLNNVTLEGNFNNAFTVSTGTLLTISGTLSTTGASTVTLTTPVLGATAIQAQGNIDIANTSPAGGGVGTILINGTGAQLFSSASAAGEGLMANISIQKTTGTLTLSGFISESRNWTFISGTVDATTDASTVVFGGNNLTIASAGMSFYNVSFTANTSTLSNSFTVNNNLTIGGLSVLAPGANIINLGGNWTNWGTAGFNEATSTVNFNGAALQTLTTPGGENFTNLGVNNSGTGIQLENNVTVATDLVMTQGNIDLNTGNVMTLGLSVANSGTLAYTAGVMLNTGSFTRWFKAVTVADGSVTGLFPMGTAANSRSFFVTAPSVSPTTGGTITVAHIDAASSTSVSFADGASTVAKIDNLHWVLTTGNGLAGGTFDLEIQGTGFGIIGSITDLRVTLVGGVVGVAGVNAGTTTTPQINRTGLTVANLSNTFYVGSVNAINSPLPITLVSFTATVINKEVALNWETSSEINNDYFTVQRSKDGATWDNLQQIAGSGNSSGNSTYTANDLAPYSGLSYYRLQQTDLDGKQTYSFICAVRLQNTFADITIFPNPATSTIVIAFPAAGNYEVRILNSVGQLMNSPMLSSGGNLVLNVSNMEAGIYFINIHHENSTETHKITIRK
jgi:hypothetical protein